MRKKQLNMRKHVAMLIAIILVVSLVACGEEQASSTSLGSNASTQQEAVVADPGPAVEEPVEAVTEEPAVEDTVQEVAEEPVVEEPVVEEPVDADNPFIVDGVDFTNFWNWIEPIQVPMSKMNYDGLRWLAVNGERTEYTVLSDGDYLGMTHEQDRYDLFLYSPTRIDKGEQIEQVSGIYTIVSVGDREYEGKTYHKVFQFDILSKDVIPENDAESIIVTYEDGTTESITIYIGWTD